jgi:transposase InsO family protein
MLPFEVVRAQIEPHLAQRKLRQALRDYAHARVHEALGHEPRAHPH